MPPRALDVLEAMEETEEATIEYRPYHHKQQKRPVALREPDVSVLSGKERAQLDEVIARLWGQTARQGSDKSHGFIGWLAAREYEIIPYETALLDNSPWTPEEEERALALMARER